ncbi:MAG: UvrABC system protein C [Deltaproteobacteria bacterium ADurb.Bin510]|nr:MAG: UvrABC system protein C [Deltaproteobacteria bacterium ADurb.Bin510]
MECYDISTIQGRHAVGSRVVFVDGRADKTLYRRYRIQDVAGQDDFAMLAEVLKRRFEHDASRPDLIVMDGGKGQLGAGLRLLKELNLSEIPMIGMAKERGAKIDRFFLPGRKDAIELKVRSAALRTMQQLRDETHRFAITYHRQLRSKAGQTSWLNQVPGIGPKKAASILKHTAGLNPEQPLTYAMLEGCPSLSAADIGRVVEYQQALHRHQTEDAKTSED